MSSIFSTRGTATIRFSNVQTSGASKKKTFKGYGDAQARFIAGVRDDISKDKFFFLKHDWMRITPKGGRGSSLKGIADASVTAESF